MYRGGRPGPLARVLNSIAAGQFGAGVLSRRIDCVLIVTGRRSGRDIRVPVVVAEHMGHRYLVSMLGEDAAWVRNVRHAGGQACLRRRRTEPVRLVEVPTAERAPILARYLAVAPGARPHFPIDRRAHVTEFAAVAARYPVFRVVSSP